MGQKINPISLRMGISRSSDTFWYTSDKSKYSDLMYQTIQLQSYVKAICKSLLYSSGRFITHHSPKKRDIFFFYTELASNQKNSIKLNQKKLSLNNNSTVYFYDKFALSHTILNSSFIRYRTPKQLILLFLLISSKYATSSLNKNTINQSIISLIFGMQKYLINKEKPLTLESSRIFEKELSEFVSIYPVKINNTSMGAQFLAEELSHLIERKKSFKFATKQLMQKIKKNPAIKGVRITCAGRLNGVEMARTDYKKYGQTSLQTISTKIDYGTSEAKTAYGIIGLKVWVCYH
jgi:ribosomal protein S3